MTRKRYLARWAGGLAIGLALLGTATAGAAWWLIESLDLKQVVARVEAALQEVTGRAVTIGAAPQLSFTPLLKLVVRDVTLGNMQGGARAEMLKLGRVEIGISLTPLLAGRRPGLSLALIEPDLLLEVGERGERNWEFKLAPEEALARLKEAVAVLEGKISLESARIERASVRFEDRRDGRKMMLTASQAVLELKKEDGYDFQLDAGINGKAITMHAEFRLPGPGELVPARVTVSLPGLNLSAQGLVRPAWPMPGTDVKMAIDMRDGAELGAALGVTLGKIPPGRFEAQLQGTAQGMRADALSITFGRSALGGSAEVTGFEPRPQIRATLDAPVLDVGELLAATDTTSAARTTKHGDGRVFPATKFPLAALDSLDMATQLKVGRLIQPWGSTLEGVQAKLSIANGRLSADPVTFTRGAGHISGRLRLDAAAANTASIEVNLQTKGVELEHLLTAAGLHLGEIKGARTDMAISLAASGDSVRAWMAEPNGEARIVVGAGRLPGKRAKVGGSFVEQAVDVANPYGASEEGSALKCIVVNVPVRSGVVSIKDAVAAETDKVLGAVSGTVDLGQERLDLTLRSQSVGGIGLADFASAAKITGTLAKPELAVNAKGAAAAGLRVGAAIATAGISLLAESAVYKAIPAHPCKAALAAKTEAKNGDARSAGAPQVAAKKSGFFGRSPGR